MFLEKRVKGDLASYLLRETEYEADGTKRTKTVAYLGQDPGDPLPILAENLLKWWDCLGKPPIFWKPEDQGYYWRINDLGMWFELPSQENIRVLIAQGLDLAMREPDRQRQEISPGRWQFVSVGDFRSGGEARK